MRSKNYIVYALLDPETNVIRYVGKTTYTLNKRFNNHISTAKTTKVKSKVLNWIRKLQKKNLKPIIMELEQFNNEIDLNNAEIFYISYFRFLTTNLLNLTDGGDGVTGFNVSKQTRNKISNSKLGKKLTEDTKLKQSNSRKKYLNSQLYLNNKNQLRNNKIQKFGKKVICINTGEIFNSINQASQILKCDESNITKVCKGKLKSTKGYKFEFLTLDGGKSNG